MEKKVKHKAAKLEKKSTLGEQFLARTPFVIFTRKKRPHYYHSKESYTRCVSIRKVI